MFLTQNPQNYINELMMYQNSSPEVPNSLMDALSSFSEKKKKPKRNRSAFILFSIDIRKKQTNEQNLGELNPNDKFVKIAQLWKEASEEVRQHYEQKAKQEKVKYVSELSNFCRNFPTEPIQRPRNHIKKPCNAYGYFLKEMKEEIRKQSPDMRMCEVLRVVGEKWKRLNTEEKEKYEKQAEASRKTFKEEVNKQMEAVKKVKTTSGSITVPQGKNKGTACDQDSLVRKDVFLPEFQVDQIISLGRSTTTTENFNLSNINQIDMNKVKQEPVVSSPSDELCAKPFATTFSAPVQPFQQGLTGVFGKTNVMLESLYWKVEKLRQQILVQLQNTPNTQNQGLMTSMNYGIPQIFEGFEKLMVKSEQSNTYESSSEEGYKKEEL